MHPTCPVESTQARKRPFAYALPWRRVIAAFFIAVILQIIVMDFHLSIYDESLSLYGALRVFHGQVPYRDFWTMYPPGEFYALAAAFRLFGVLAIWDRVLFVIGNAVGAVAMLYILNRLTGRVWLSRFSTVAILLWMNAKPSYAFPIYPAIALILVAAACMLRRWRDGDTRSVFVAGVALGLAALFRHDLALYALLAAGCASLAHQMRTLRAECAGPVWGDLARLAATAFVVVLPVLILLLVYVPLHDLYYDLIYVPGVIYPKVRSLHFPNLSEVRHGFHYFYKLGPVLQGGIEYNIVFLPPLVVLSCVALLFRRRPSPASPAWQTTGILCLALLSALMFLKGLVRVSPLHLAPAVVPALMLLACLLARLRDLTWPGRAVVLFTAAWAAFCVFATANRDYFVLTQNLSALRGTDPSQSFSEACHRPETLSRARCVFLPPDEQSAILYVQSHTAPADRIFVGVPRYDILHLSDIEIYFFSKRDAGTAWYDLHPGVETTAPIQNQMIRDLDQNHVRLIVRDNLIYPDEPNQSRISSGINLLGDYINTNYTLQRSFGKIDVLARSTPFASEAAFSQAPQRRSHS